MTRKLVTLLCAFLMLVSPALSGTLAIDLFNRANENPLNNGVWTGGYTSRNAIQLVSNAVEGTTLATEHWSGYTGVTLPNDQFSQLTYSTYSTGGVNSGGGPACRMATSPTLTAYYVDTNGSDFYRVTKILAGATTVLTTTSTAAASGAVARLECKGSTQTLIVNGVVLATTSDGAISSGKAGMVLYVAGALGNTIFDSFSTGGLTTQLPMMGIGQ